jgi:HD-like signal output (HDOD) protein
MYESVIQEYEGAFGQGWKLDDIVSWVESLPPMPDVACRAMRLVDDPDASAGDLARVLADDPALALSILRSANSAALGRGAAATSLDEAIVVVGMGALRSLLITVTLRDWNKKFGPIERLIWEKSLGAAVAAELIASQLRKSYRDEIRLTGLLHNLGQIVLLSHEEIGPRYMEVMACIRDAGMDYATAERDVIGFSHPLVGALVARKWGFPDPTCQIILRYGDPFDGVGNRLDEQIALVKLATELSLCAGIGHTPGHPLNCGRLTPLATAIGFLPDTLVNDLDQLTRQTRERFLAEVSAYA